MGGGRGRDKRKPNKNDNNNRSNKSNQKKQNRSRSKNSSFVEGGLLTDWSLSTSCPSSSGKSRYVDAKSGLRSANSSQIKPDSASKSGSRKCGGSAFSYNYPPSKFQNGWPPELSAENNSRKNDTDESTPIALVDSKESQIFAYLDEATSSRAQNAELSCGYTSGLVLGDGSHRGLGFCNESDEELGVTEEEDQESDSSYSAKEIVADQSIDDVTAKEMDEKTVSPKKNTGFLSIGGMKLFTEDISDGESDEEYDEVMLEDDDDESESSEQEETNLRCNSDSSGNTFDSDTDIDEEVAKDYLEGIGGSDNILDNKWLLGNDLDDPEEDTSSDCFEETVEKLGGIVLQDASRSYGIKKPHTKQKSPAAAGDVWPTALDDFMLVKDPRTLSARKKHVSLLPKSWPLEAQKSKSSRNFPGAKKKHRKEAIAIKRRERMLRRGVDLEKINTMLEGIVVDEVDVFSFHPMHSKDCAQVQRLAAIYRLRSWCQGSGKKRFVTVTRSQHTGLPSASDRIRLEKLIGAGNEDADFALTEGSNKRLSGADRSRMKGGGLSTRGAKSSSNKKCNDDYSKRTGEKGSYANQPVSFVSSGIMESETVEIKTVDPNYKNEASEVKLVATTATFGAFEAHTRGFGSRMMAKMGFVEGAGLGKDGQGMAEPIEVTQRPKSLGLGVDLPTTSSDAVSSKVESSGIYVKPKFQNLGAFEKHTKGFGSKMMTRMGFVEGMGLGKNSQGIVNPLAAVRLPKSRGLGAKT